MSLALQQTRDTPTHNHCRGKSWEKKKRHKSQPGERRAGLYNRGLENPLPTATPRHQCLEKRGQRTAGGTWLQIRGEETILGSGVNARAKTGLPHKKKQNKTVVKPTPAQDTPQAKRGGKGPAKEQPEVNAQQKKKKSSQRKQTKF